MMQTARRERESCPCALLFKQKQYAMKMYVKVDVWIYVSFTSTTSTVVGGVGGEWSASPPGRFTSGERGTGPLGT
jgi:hypothetical protein